MKLTDIHTTLLLSAVIGGIAAGSHIPAMSQSTPKFRHVVTTPERVAGQVLADRAEESYIEPLREAAAARAVKAVDDSLELVRSVKRIEETIAPYTGYSPSIDMSLTPRVFMGYRHLSRPEAFRQPFEAVITPQSTAMAIYEMQCEDYHHRRELYEEMAHEIEEKTSNGLIIDDEELSEVTLGDEPQLPVLTNPLTDAIEPSWLRQTRSIARMQEDLKYWSMINNPRSIEYAYWDLPVPPTMPDEEFSLRQYLAQMQLPAVEVAEKLEVDENLEKRHWLHVFNTGLQFSQAYLSKNWYQGGNNYLSLLFNFLWDVQLNQVYHPRLMFQSTLSYKLGLNSVRDDPYHNYSISQDLFQYNIKFGYKAAHNWYYSFTGQFKTQLLNNYPSNSETRIASFLSPADLNIGLGMTYSKTNKNKTVVFNASIAPLSYNMRCCIDPKINVTQYNIKEGHKVSNEFGSNAELTLAAKIGSNITYNSRLFLFSDYSYFQGDWEHTLNFQFNKYFSTQLYANIRYDSSIDAKVAPKWGKWMIKEILSVGLSYSFSTKVK